MASALDFPRSMNTSNRALRNRQRFLNILSFRSGEAVGNLLSPAALVVLTDSRFLLVAARPVGMRSSLGTRTLTSSLGNASDKARPGFASE
jgi:hypothetical protein